MRSRWPAVASIALALVACSDGGTGPAGAPALIAELPRSLTSAEVGTIGSANGFGFELLRRLYAAPQGGQANVFISPVSASMMLGMAVNGAGGDTYDAMIQTLGLDGLTQEQVNASYSGLVDLLLGLDSSVQIELVNGVWLQEGVDFLPDYLTRVRDAFGANVENLDFTDPASATHINDWAAESTHDRIRQVVTPDEIRDALAVLANALYFKGSWRTQFDPDETRTTEFYLPDSSTVDVPMMRQAKIEDEVRLRAGPDYMAVDLPYGGAAFSMTLVLPDPGTTLDELVAETDAAWWSDLVEGLFAGEASILLPRFEIRYGADLVPPLTDMGMGVAFTDQADFSRMVDTDALLTAVTQSTFVRVDEEGTEAAAVTVGVVGTTSAPLPIRFDRPFLFAIRERLSGTILFVGTITNPTVD